MKLARHISLALSLLSIAPFRLAAVTPFPAGALILRRANYFDLQSRRIRFLPAGASGYKVSVSASLAQPKRGSKMAKPGASLSLPFPFPFGGRKWTAVYVNLNGNLTFDSPDTTTYPERDTWPDGTMRGLASFLDTQAMEGRLRTIAPFWGLNSAEGTSITTSSSPRELTVTWDAIRYQSRNEAYAPLGRSVFQVSLGRDGSIEFRYGMVPEKDGIAGIFPGLAGSARTLDTADPTESAPAHPAIDVRHAAVEELGPDLRFTLRAAAPIPEKSSGGTLSYRIFVVSGGMGYYLTIDVDRKGRSAKSQCFLINPDHNGTLDDCSVSALIMTDGASVTAYVPKIGLRDPATFSWRAEAAFQADSQDPAVTVTTGGDRDVRVAFPMPSGIDLSAPPPAAAGAIFEVFHYPFVPKSRQRALKAIYSKLPADDDLAIVLTDFRIDDIHNHGSSNGELPVGNRYEEDPEGRYALYGSRKLQRATGPIYLGPRFDDAPHDQARTWRNYPFAVGWMAHEMTHRWAAYATWKGFDPQALLFRDEGHWSPFLNTPAVYPVSQLFTDTPYTEESVMGGMHAVEHPDGTHTGEVSPWGAATGLSALDLYLMGMIGEEDVPDTVLIRGAVAYQNGRPVTPAGDHGLEGAGAHGGEVVPVRIGDIIGAGGPRTPPASEAQRRFTLGMYLLYEDGREADRDKLAQARGIEAALVKYFSVATGGRMTVVPH
jgi:hypothetical protein